MRLPVRLGFVLLVGAGALLIPLTVAHAQEKPSRCSPGPAPSAEQSSPAAGAKLISEKDKIEIPFGTDRAFKTREIPLRVDGSALVEPDQLRAVVRGDILREDRASTLPKRDQVTLTPVGVAGLLTMQVCVDPGRPVEAEPGTYQGSILIIGPGVEAATVPLVVTLSENDWWKPVLAALLGALAGIGVKSLRDILRGGERAHSNLKSYLQSLQFLVQFATGLVFAGIVFWRTYLESTNFGGGGWRDYGGLIAASFAAVLTGSIFGDLGVGVTRRVAGDGKAEENQARAA